LQTRWCAWSRRLERETFADPRVVELLAGSTVPVRVDAERYPHVRDRYVTTGWPTNAFLTPSGGVLWTAPFLEAEELLSAAAAVLSAWKERGGELEAELQRRRDAVASARGRRSRGGMPRREAGDDVMAFLRQAFDARNGGFGEAPKYPPIDAVALLYAGAERSGDGALAEMADRTLDGMLAGELRDPESGAFHRYTLGEDWTRPSTERLLAVNAELARCYALAAALRGRDDWREAAERAITWVTDALARDDGLMAASFAATPDPADGSSGGAGSEGQDASARDDTALADANATWVRCLADAGAALGRRDWTHRARALLGTIRERFDTEGAKLPLHFLPGSDEAEAERSPRGLLVDAVEMLAAAVAVARATGETEALSYACDLADRMERGLWTEKGAFLDRSPDPSDPLGAPDRPFHENAAAAAALLTLDALADAGGARSQAERILAFLSPSAGHYGLDAAGFALATLEFFDPAPVAVIRADREASGALRDVVAGTARSRFWHLSEDAVVAGRAFDADGEGAAWVKRDGDWSGPAAEAPELRVLLGG
jgi:uncharacterized protein YyaL (SSP411 family)